jgi:hypothetical protein
MLFLFIMLLLKLLKLTVAERKFSLVPVWMCCASAPSTWIQRLADRFQLYKNQVVTTLTHLEDESKSTLYYRMIT